MDGRVNSAVESPGAAVSPAVHSLRPTSRWHLFDGARPPMHFGFACPPRQASRGLSCSPVFASNTGYTSPKRYRQHPSASAWGNSWHPAGGSLFGRIDHLEPRLRANLIDHPLIQPYEIVGTSPLAGGANLGRRRNRSPAECSNSHGGWPGGFSGAL